MSNKIDTKGRLWIVTELFPPDETSTSYIFGEIANAMVQKYNVGVICGPEVYDKRKKFDENNMFKLDESIELYRAKGADLDKNTTKGKALSCLIMSKRMIALVKQHVKRGDKVLMVTNPAPLVVLMSRLKKKAVYFKRGDEAKVEQLAANSLEADELPKSDANGVVRIDMLLSSDTAFAAAQVFSCTDYMYNPVGDIHIYTGSDAKLFITKIRQITR